MTLFLISGMLFGVLVSFGYRLTPLLFNPRRVTLAFSPASLRMGEVVLAILSMIAKSIFYAIPGFPRIKLSALELDSPFTLGADDVVRYQAAVGGTSNTGEELSAPQLMLFLSAMTEPAMLLLLASPWCPINPLGAVNVRNRFEILRPDLCDLSRLVDLRTARLNAIASNYPRPAKRGIEWDLEVVITTPTGRKDGTMDIIFRQIFTMLELRKSQSKKIRNSSHETRSSMAIPQMSESTTQVSMSVDDPLKWAAICKDYNFIHLSGAAAKAFGLSGKIAHGNHTVVKALHLLTDSKSLQPPFTTSSWMEVQFRRPMVVPGVFDVSLRESGKPSKTLSVSFQGRDCAIAEFGSLQQ